MLNSFIRGLRLGIILQLSIGPVCLFILQTAIARGITEALKAVLAVVLVDAFYTECAGGTLSISCWHYMV